MNEWIEALEKEILSWRQDPDQNSHIPVLNAVAAAAANQAEVLVPVVIPDSVFEGMDMSQYKAGDTVHIDGEIRMQIQHLDGEGGRYIPVFTGEAEVAKGAETSTVNQTLAAMVDCALQEEGCLGLVINPWENSATLSREVLERIRQAITPDPDLVEINQVLAAYRQGTNQGDAELLRPLFHQDAVIFWDGAPSDVHSHAISWFHDAIAGAGPDDEPNPPFQAQVLDITGGIAVIKVTETWKGAAYTDYFSMVKTEAGWKIAAKLFHNHTAAGETAE